ncbi:unnamed protein product [Cunninghamella echinulata]
MKQKTKTQLQSLWSFIDATNTFDQSRFFQENAEQVFHVIYNCMHQIEKIKQRHERPQNWNSKELVSLQKTLFLLRKLFLFIPELMRNGWQRKNIAKILTYILDHGNHIRLRSLGFQLLLLWLNDQVVEYPECINLFSNAIPLDLFIMDEICTTPSSANTNMEMDTNNSGHTSTLSHSDEKDSHHHKLHSSSHSTGLQFVKKLSERNPEKIQGLGLVRNDHIKNSSIYLKQNIILGDENPPLYPSSTIPTFNDSVVLLNIFITNLVRLAYVASGSPPPPDNYDYPDQYEADDGIATGVGIDAATASAKFLFKIFKTYYLTKFVPFVSTVFKEESKGQSTESVVGFPLCPPSILRTILRFLIGFCLDNTHNNHSHHQNIPSQFISSPATPILKSIVLSSHETREMLHEILRQCMILPITNPNYRDITRGAIHILGVWMLGNEEERPSFLRRTNSTPASASTIITSGSHSVHNMNSANDIIRSNSFAALSTPKHILQNDTSLSSSTATDNNNNNINMAFISSPALQFATSGLATMENHDYVEANVFLRRYFLMIKLIFENDNDNNKQDSKDSNTMEATTKIFSSDADWESAVALYKDAINVYRAITVTRGGIEMECESWETLLQCLLDIQDWMMLAPDTSSQIPVTSLADDFVEYLYETMLYAYARARIAHVSYWKELKKRLVSTMQWYQVLEQWVKIMHRLTRTLSSKLYKVDYESYRLPGLSSFDKPGTVQNRLSAHFSGNNSGGGNANSGRKPRTRHLSIQDEQRGNNVRAARPTSGAGTGAYSEGHFNDLVSASSIGQHDYPDRIIVDLSEGFPLPPGIEIPTTTVSTSYTSTKSSHRDVNTTTSFFEKAKCSDRRSGGMSIQQQQQQSSLATESIEEDKPMVSSISGSHSTSRKFGIKNIIPSSSFSSSYNLSSSSNNANHIHGNNNNNSNLHGNEKSGMTEENNNNNNNSNNNTHISNVNIQNGSGSVSSSTGSRRGKRAVSIHQFDTLFQESGSKLLNFVHQTTSASIGSPSSFTTTATGTTIHQGNATAASSINGGVGGESIYSTTSKLTSGTMFVKEDDKGKTLIEWDRKSNASSNVTISSKSNRTSASTILPPVETITMKMNPANVNDQLPSDLGIFRSTEFLNLQNLTCDGLGALILWKNMLCTIGNLNMIQSTLNYTIAIKCVVDIWDTLVWVRSNQPYRGVPFPALYEITPWLIQATELPSKYDNGRAYAFGSLCRLVCRKPEEHLPDSFYAHFYRCVLKGLASENDLIIQSIIQNSERIFAFSLPGVHILIPPFIHAIEKQLLDGNTLRNAPTSVQKSCITILGSLTSTSNHFSDVQIKLKAEDNKDKIFQFSEIKVWLKNLLVRLVNACSPSSHINESTDVQCMLLGALCSLTLDELLSCKDSQRSIIDECILAMLNHLYQCNVSIINTVTDCLILVAHIYRESLDPEGAIVQEVLTRIIDALNEHLKIFKNSSKCGRGLVISKLFSCLLEWLMTIEPEIVTDTELCQLVFNTIECAMNLSAVDTEKVVPHSPITRNPSRSKKKELPFKFILLTEKRPPVHQDSSQSLSGSEHDENEDFVKEAAEAVLFHLLHHFNNFAPPYGPATMHSNISGPGVSTTTEDKSDTEYKQFQYFSFNETTIIAFLELPASESNPAETRVIVRDMTGKYVWDAHLVPFSNEPDSPSPSTINTNQSENNSQNRIDQLLDGSHGYSLRSNISVVKSDLHSSNQLSRSNSNSYPSSPDTLNSLLQEIGDNHPECLASSPIKMDTSSSLTSLQLSMVGRLGDQLNEYLENENQNNLQKESDPRLWYSKLNVLRRRNDQALNSTETTHSILTANFSLKKDFSPAFPQEVEKTNVPFQQSRLLMSHLGLINYNDLKDGSFQLLNKTTALYRDLRGLDRKPGRETMKIGVIYVGPEQEDEQSILCNNQGSPEYNSFVNSLGWEIDIATHTAYLGGLERNLTNGTKATYYCSSTVEMIFHDVTKMPTDAHDPKQLKKKRHIGNDHVHIVWNEHDRDYRSGTIGGDFGNAQIVVTPLSDGLYSIQIYRDSKIPYFGPLFNEMVVSKATLGSLVRATAIGAFRSCVHTNTSSFHRSVFTHRARDIKTITHRHKVSTWSYEKFMEQMFLCQ